MLRLNEVQEGGGSSSRLQAIGQMVCQGGGTRVCHGTEQYGFDVFLRTGGSRNYVEAYAWSLHAAVNGDSRRKDYIAERLTPEQIEQGQVRAKELQKEMDKKKAPPSNYSSSGAGNALGSRPLVQRRNPSKMESPQGRKVWAADLGSGVKMEFMPIAAGSFLMGSNNGDDDEKPVHRVTFTKPFWLAKTEVTQAQWKQIMGINPSHFRRPDLPVESVGWDDAVAFCKKKLTERERQAGCLPAGFEYTLPTEAQ